MSTLQIFLDAKPLFYDEIDLERMPKVYKSIRFKLPSPKVIHIVGTNGKGTTGRFLADALLQNTLNVGHYTSPHILSFNERIWLNGANVEDSILEEAHIVLLGLLTTSQADALSYFEYTTLLAMVVYKDCDYVVLEAGLGGEHDATAVFPKELTLVTPIAFDHEAFLGSSLEAIATTKLNAIQKNAILGVQKFDEIVKIAKQKNANIYQIDELLDNDDLLKIKEISSALSLPKYLEDNLKLSISALRFLNINYKSENFNNARLFGRLSRLEENIYLDVGHNTLAATSILEALQGDKYTLVYNSYKDKDYPAILKILKPIIKEVQILQICDERIETKELIHKTLIELKIKYKQFKKIEKYEKYLVFGSFSVAEEFLKVYNG